MTEDLWEESMLKELAANLRFPATPDLRPAVLGQISTSRRTSLPVRRFVLTAAAVLVLAFVLTVTVSQDARDAVAGFLGLAVEGERIEVLPTPSGGRTPTPLPTALPTSAALDAIASLMAKEDVPRQFNQPLVLPASLGEPARYYVLREGPSMVIADYGAIQIWEFPYEGDYFVGKGIVGGGEVVRSVTVNGRPGYWVTGGSRIVTIFDAAGRAVSGTQRTVTSNALIWSDGGLYRRIEGVATLEDGLRLASEMP